MADLLEPKTWWLLNQTSIGLLILYQALGFRYLLKGVSSKLENLGLLGVPRLGPGVATVVAEPGVVSKRVFFEGVCKPKKNE